MGSAFDLGFQQTMEKKAQQRQIAEQQRIQNQNTVGMRLLDSINQASSIKPQVKDPTTGELIDNPAYADAQKDRASLMAQYSALNAPEQHASFGQHLHGLIFGHADHRPQQPALSPNSSPNELGQDPAQGQAPTSSAAPAPPPHPMAPLPQDHPANKIMEGIKTLGSHLSAFAHPPPAQQQPDTALMAKYYRDPEAVKAENAQALANVKGENALDVAKERTKALTASLSARRPTLLSETTIPDILKEMDQDPSMQVFGPNGNQLSRAQIAEMPPDLVAREWRAGNNIFTAFGNKNSKTLNVNGQIYDIPALGEINIAGPKQNSAVVGQATSTLPHTSSTTDPFGLTTTSQRQTVVPPVDTPTPAAPSGPVLLTRPGSNPGARLPGTQPAGAAVKAKPVSAAAPTAPTGSLPPLDENGHIPVGVGNDLIRQAANGILDGRDPKEFGNPKVQTAALALVDKFVPNYSRGAFTPKEKIQFGVAINFLDQLKNSNSLSVLDSFVSREKIAHAMKAPEHMNMADRVIAFNLSPKEAEFVKLFNAARGTVAGLSQITRSGRATNSQVNTIAQELPNVFQSSSSADARSRVEQLLKEADIALHTNPRDVGKGGPVSKNAPQVGSWKPPADAPPAPKEDNKVLKADGKVIAISKGGNWTDPNAH
jgi:hypothetical protein